MSGSNKDEDRATELRSKVTSYQNMTAKDNQTALDFARIVRIAQDEIRSKRGTP
jgi:hypothetical protein